MWSMIDSMAATAKTAKMKRYRALGFAIILTNDAELDLLDWLVAVRRNGMPVAATMLQQEALEVARMCDVPPAAFGASAT
ncbi:unnamed protein product [Phytophthora fragariaefolia]|uniref:Unnamed protein product n=1 Tax=Phytophthora fragariaefolia TaxID=1490495 RepID=A0A9W7D0Y4_9STRA|nr:unnamed protein product [Phytophthora fragariaefolia]